MKIGILTHFSKFQAGYFNHPHSRPLLINFIVHTLTWNFFAICLFVYFFVAAILLISFTFPSVSFEYGFCSPFIEVALFFLALSTLLSETVPRNRWDGFTHQGLSQVWQTHMPFGMLPFSNFHIYLWAFSGTPGEDSKTPYFLSPLLSYFPTMGFHSQHFDLSFWTSTLSQNRHRVVQWFWEEFIGANSFLQKAHFFFVYMFGPSFMSTNCGEHNP